MRFQERDGKECVHGCVRHATGMAILNAGSRACARRSLQMLGATVEGPEPREFNGLAVELWPRVSWSPLFALTFADLQVCGRS